MTDTTSIPLNKLAVWDGNVRKTAGADTGLAELSASIAAHGLLQSLVVRKGKKGKYAVVAGGRRLAALQSLAESGKIAGDYPVPCQVIAADADASEISLAENTVRENMHPADEFDAFCDLIDKGTPVADIAARFGVTPRTVEQRLKLARVSPVIIGAFRQGELNLAQVMAFAASDDHAAQEQLFENLSDWNGDPDDIRGTLTDHEISANDARVKFVTLKAYEKAGGGVRRDLFAEGNDGVFILDAVLLDSLVALKLTKTANEVAKEGWKWVEIRAKFDYQEWSGCERRHQEPVALEPEIEAQLQCLQMEYEKLNDAEWEGDEDNPRLDEIIRRIEEIEDREKIWSPETLAIAGAVVALDYHGKADITRGIVKPEDRPARTKTVQRINDDGAVETVEVAEASTLPASLIESLTLHRTAAISAELINRPDIALASLVHTLAAQEFLGGASGNTCLEIFATSKSMRGVEGAKAFDAMKSARENWCTRFPGTPDALWTWCLEQDQQVLLGLLAFCLARSVDAVRTKKDGTDDHRFAHADRLAASLNLDMSAWFNPTAENYFGRISKTRILEAIREARGATAPAWEKAKKGDLAAIAERELAETGWLPEVLRKAA